MGSLKKASNSVLWLREPSRDCGFCLHSERNLLCSVSESQSPIVINGEENAEENEVKCPDCLLP